MPLLSALFIFKVIRLGYYCSGSNEGVYLCKGKRCRCWLSGMTLVAKPHPGQWTPVQDILSVLERQLLRRCGAPEGTVVRDGRARAGARALPRPLLQAGKEGDGFGGKVGIILLLLTRSLTHLDTQSHDTE